MHLCPRKFSAYNISRARVTTCWNQLNVSLCKVWMSQQTWGSWSGMDVVIDTSCVNCGTWDLVAFRHLKTDNQLYSLLQTSNLKLHQSYLMFWIIDWVAILESINFLASCRPVYVLQVCMFSFISWTWCWSLQLCSDFSSHVSKRDIGNDSRSSLRTTTFAATWWSSASGQVLNPRILWQTKQNINM
jgi:hypothetical protein